MNIIVTGAAGFVGSWLCEKLLSMENCNVIGIDNFSNGERRNMDSFKNHSNFYFYEHDLSIVPETKLSAIAERLGEQVDYVYHLAALGSVPRSIGAPRDTFKHNVQVTHDLLHWSAKHGVKRFFFASSSSVYGNLNREFKSEHDPTDPINPYGMSKLVGEQYCKMFERTYGMPTTAFRFFNVYGPRQKWKDKYAAVLPCWIERTLDKKPIILNNNGTQLRDFTYVSDVVDVLCKAIHCASRPVYNVACGNAVKLVNFAEDYFKSIGLRPNMELIFEPREGDILTSQADIRMLREDFNFSPIRTRRSIIKTYAYYKGLLKNG